jgi:hypothetical protein
MSSSLAISMFKMLFLIVKSVLSIKRRGFQRKKKPITKHSKLRVIVEHTIYTKQIRNIWYKIQKQIKQR